MSLNIVLCQLCILESSAQSGSIFPVTMLMEFDDPEPDPNVPSLASPQVFRQVQNFLQ